MSGQLKEAKMVMAIEALRNNRKLRVYKAARIYDVPNSTLHDRIDGRQSVMEHQQKNRLLNELEEEVLVQHIVDLDNREFLPRLKDIEDMANNILASHYE